LFENSFDLDLNHGIKFQISSKELQKPFLYPLWQPNFFSAQVPARPVFLFFFLFCTDGRTALAFSLLAGPPGPMPVTSPHLQASLGGGLVAACWTRYIKSP
jgi:hypothetical protein